MAVFTYQAVTTEGETKSGTIAASSEQEAVTKVQLMGLMVMNIASGAATVYLGVSAGLVGDSEDVGVVLGFLYSFEPVKLFSREAE